VPVFLLAVHFDYKEMGRVTIDLPAAGRHSCLPKEKLRPFKPTPQIQYFL
jgi:hypothetical protein